MHSETRRRRPLLSPVDHHAGPITQGRSPGPITQGRSRRASRRGWSPGLVTRARSSKADRSRPITRSVPPKAAHPKASTRNGDLDPRASATQLSTTEHPSAALIHRTPLGSPASIPVRRPLDSRRTSRRPLTPGGKMQSPATTPDDIEATPDHAYLTTSAHPRRHFIRSPTATPPSRPNPKPTTTHAQTPGLITKAHKPHTAPQAAAVQAPTQVRPSAETHNPSQTRRSPSVRQQAPISTQAPTPVSAQILIPATAKASLHASAKPPARTSARTSNPASAQAPVQASAQAPVQASASAPDPASAPVHSPVPSRPARITWPRFSKWVHYAAVNRERGMSTAEYAVGTIAACAFAALLFKVVSSPEVQEMLTALINRALNTTKE